MRHLVRLLGIASLFSVATAVVLAAGAFDPGVRHSVVVRAARAIGVAGAVSTLYCLLRAFFGERLWLPPSRHHRFEVGQTWFQAGWIRRRENPAVFAVHHLLYALVAGGVTAAYLRAFWRLLELRR